MRKQWILSLAGVALAAGCTQRPPIFITNDPSLRRPSVELSADAVKRFPYKTDLPRGGEAVARAQVGYSLNVIEIVNLSDQDWQDVEVWINKSWVVHLPTMQRGKLKRIPFSAIFDDSGKNFPNNNRVEKIRTVEVLREGMLFDVPVQLAD